MRFSLLGIALACFATSTAAQEQSGAKGATRSFSPDFFAEAQPVTALDMVQRVPGFSIATGASVRGYTGSVGNVLIDGERPASKTESIVTALQAIPATLVARIDLISGANAEVDMQGRQQIVNIILRQPPRRQTTATPGAWVFADGRVRPGGRLETRIRQGDDHGFDASFESQPLFADMWHHGERVDRGADGSIMARTPLYMLADGRSSTARASVIRPVLGGRLTATGRYSIEDFASRQDQGVGASLQRTRDEVEGTVGEFGLSYRRRLFGQETETVLLQTYGETDRLSKSPSADFSATSTSGESILRTRWSGRRSPTLLYEASAEGAFNFLDGKRRLVQGGREISLPSANVRVEELRGELAGLATWHPRPNLAISGGTRFEVSQISQTGDAELRRRFFYPKPSLSVAWTIRPQSKLRGKLERSVSQLSFSDFTASAELANDVLLAGNANLVPEKVWALEAVMEQNFWTTGVVSLTARARAIEDAIDLIPIDNRFDAPGNIGDARAWEGVLAFAAPTARLGWAGGLFRVNATWRDSRVTDPVTGESRRISFQRPFESVIGFTQDIERLKTTVTADFNSGWREESFRLAEVIDNELTHWVNLAAEYKPSDKLSIRLQYTDLDAYERERTFYAGSRATSPITRIEQRRMPPPYRLHVRVRRVF